MVSFVSVMAHEQLFTTKAKCIEVLLALSDMNNCSGNQKDTVYLYFSSYCLAKKLKCKTKELAFLLHFLRKFVVIC